MSRIKIEMPDNYLFSTRLGIRISDINYGNHLGNDTVLSFMHEARVRFFKHYGYTEMDVDGFGIIMTDTSIIYKAEGFYGDELQIDVTVRDFNKYGCDIYYLVSNQKTAVEVAHAKTGIVFFDYKERKVVPVPEGFHSNIMKDT